MSGQARGRRSERRKVAEKGTPARASEPEASEEHALTAILPNRYGLHMRPAKDLVELANSFPCEIALVAKGRDADAKSILGVIGLGVECGDEVGIRARGRQAKEAAGAIVKLIASLPELYGEPTGKKKTDRG